MRVACESPTVLKALARSRSPRSWLRDPLLSLGRAVGELGAKRRSRAGVDAKRRRALRKEAEKVFGKLVEQRERIGFGRGGRRRRTLASARGHERQGDGGCECGDGFAAAHQCQQGRGSNSWSTRQLNCRSDGRQRLIQQLHAHGRAALVAHPHDNQIV